MKPLNFLREDLKHIRTIHFSMVIVAAICIYLAVSSWSDSPAVLIELAKFESVSGELQTRLSDKELVGSLFPLWVARNSQETAKIVQKRTGEILALPHYPELHDDFQNSLDSFFNVRLEPVPKVLEKVRLEVARTLMESTKWTVESLGNLLPVHPGNVKEIKEWVRASAEKQRWFGPRIDEIRVQGKKVLVAKIVFYEVTSVAGADLNAPPRTYESVADSRELVLHWEGREEIITVGPQWFPEAFPLLDTYWQNLGKFDFEKAREWARDERLAAFKGKEVDLGGILKVDAHDVGYIGPLIIFSMLSYIYFHLSHVKNYVLSIPKPTENTLEVSILSPWIGAMGNGWVIGDTKEKTLEVSILSPWIGAMGNGWAIVATIVTLVVVPCAGVFLTLWRLLDQLVIGVGVGAITFGMGVVGVYLGMKISQEHIEIED